MAFTMCLGRGQEDQHDLLKIARTNTFIGAEMLSCFSCLAGAPGRGDQSHCPVRTPCSLSRESWKGEGSCTVMSPFANEVTEPMPVSEDRLERMILYFRLKE